MPNNLLPDEPLQDKQLLETLRSGKGEPSTLNTLLERYFNPLKFYIYKYKLSWNMEESFITEIVHQSVLNVLKAIQSDRFAPTTIAHFKSFLFETCKRTCWDMNRKEKRQIKTASEVFPEGMPDDIFIQRDTNVSDFDYLRMKLEKALPSLNKREKRLLKLIGGGKTYKQIKEKDKVLRKHTIDYLMQMMYIIKKKIRS